LEQGNYFAVKKDQIVSDNNLKIDIVKKYIKAIENNHNKFLKNYYSSEKLERHLFYFREEVIRYYVESK
jgi:hypothetical protein